MHCSPPNRNRLSREKVCVRQVVSASHKNSKQAVMMLLDRKFFWIREYSRVTRKVQFCEVSDVLMQAATKGRTGEFSNNEK